MTTMVMHMKRIILPLVAFLSFSIALYLIHKSSFTAIMIVLTVLGIVFAVVAYLMERAHIKETHFNEQDE